MKTKKSWREKIDGAPARKVETLSDKDAIRMKARTLLIPHPTDVETIARTVKKGKLLTTEQIRKHLAAKFGAETTCPLCTGIFMRIISEAAEEATAEGQTKVTPYWRVLKSDGSLNEKYPGGFAAQREKLESEGHTVGGTLKKPRVEDYEKKLMALE
jgi:alkylated DNA nucleotide flippase Atl1